MNKYDNIIIMIMTIVFLIIFLYSIFHLINNKIIKFRVTKIPLLKKKINNNYKSPIFCDENHIKKIKYDLCNICKKKGKCYDENKGICISCIYIQNCEKDFNYKKN